jgi:CubicO group peptidase (beta-lactamase class C family)
MGMLVTVAARSDQDDWNIRTARAMKILLAAVLAFVLAPVLARAEGWQTSSPEAQGMSSRELAGLVEFGIANGMDSVLVVRHGSIVAEAYYAPFAPGMKHRINSATKSVIGSLVSIALKDGLLKNVDQPVLGFFPERSFANMDERKKALRLRHLLDMTSGLEWDEPLSAASFESLLQMERSPDWVQFILDHPMVREPGAAFEYNSGNPHVLSAILSKVTGRSALDYARQKLFGPLGIEDVFWRHDPQGVSAGGAGLSAAARHGETGPALARRRCLEGRAPAGARLDRLGEARFPRDGPGSPAALRQPLLVAACEGRLPGRGL